MPHRADRPDERTELPSDPDPDWTFAEARTWQLFNPSSPIDEESLFSGRSGQVADLLGAVYEKGAHAIVYGERGVGKSSLANIISTKISPAATKIRFLKENCRPEDTFITLWSKSLFSHQPNGASISELWKNETREFVVIKALEELPRNTQFVFVFDEFDRISSSETKAGMADTIKHFSDYPTNITIIVVGVGHSVEDLFGAHPSIQRCCRQIPLRRMSKPELCAMLADRYSRIGLQCSENMMDRLVDLSCGFPGNLHAAGREAALCAVRAKRGEITEHDYFRALSEAVRLTQDSVVGAYNKATHRANQTIYKEVLRACAMAKSDDRGMFTAADIRDALAEILGRRVEIANFAKHLAAFCDPDRGPVLCKSDKDETPTRYQFLDSALERYVFLTARKAALTGC